LNPDLRKQIESETGEEFEYKKLEQGLNTIYQLSARTQDYILKIHTNPENKIQWFKAEPRIYEKIYHELDIPSPKVIYKDLDPESFENAFYLMQKLEGKNPKQISDNLNTQDITAIVEQYGKILGKIHKLKISEEYGIIGYEDGEYGPPDSAKQWNWALEGSMSAWKDKIEEKWENPPKIKFKSEKVKHKVPSKPEPVLTHSDNRLDNLLIKNNKITGFLDWSHPWSAHRVYDLVKTEYYLIEQDIGNLEKETDKEKLKQVLYQAYREETCFQKSEQFQQIRKIYRYATALEKAAGFTNWGPKLDEQEHEEMRQKIVESLKREKPKELAPEN
jgi:aminoglycoside phosphotransferase (APT) family kinase protein